MHGIFGSFGYILGNIFDAMFLRRVLVLYQKYQVHIHYGRENIKCFTNISLCYFNINHPPNLFLMIILTLLKIIKSDIVKTSTKLKARLRRSGKPVAQSNAYLSFFDRFPNSGKRTVKAKTCQEGWTKVFLEMSQQKNYFVKLE